MQYSTAEMLRPEKQSLELFAAGVDAIVEAQRLVALNYFGGRQRRGCVPSPESAPPYHGAGRL